MCDRVGVLYAGPLVEQGATADLFHKPNHPYTAGLLGCIPRGGLHKSADRLETISGTPPVFGTHYSGCVLRRVARLLTTTTVLSCHRWSQSRVRM
ncbi:MAG: oligopeptide/dipeptide ABC transporter ATP-binding protein [Burkholderiaceae bacterium]